eukprot:765343-Pyramimonas_sp.AAC.1
MYCPACPGALATMSVSSAYTSSSTIPDRSPRLRLASLKSTVMTITETKGDNGHPWQMPALCSRDVE